MEEAEIRLWVEDEGPGLPSQAVESLFAPFARSPGEEPEESGMGLGLYVVKSIVERHGGRVEAEGGGPGARMCVVLPREEAERGTDEDPRRR